jgi:hypothetical protein
MLTEYSILQQHNIHSSQQPMELSPGETDRILGHKASLNKYKKTDILSNHNTIKLEFNNKRNSSGSLKK